MYMYHLTHLSLTPSFRPLANICRFFGYRVLCQQTANKSSWNNPWQTGICFIFLVWVFKTTKESEFIGSEVCVFWDTLWFYFLLLKDAAVSSLIQKKDSRQSDAAGSKVRKWPNYMNSFFLSHWLNVAVTKWYKSWRRKIQGVSSGYTSILFYWVKSIERIVMHTHCYMEAAVKFLKLVLLTFGFVCSVYLQPCNNSYYGEWQLCEICLNLQFQEGKQMYQCKKYFLSNFVKGIRQVGFL